MSKQLPPQPHLDSLKKQARQLLKGYESDQSDAVERVRAALAELPPSAAESFTLRQAQQVVAREYGFSSWQKLVDEVGHPLVEEKPQNSYVAHYNRMARDLVATLHTVREVGSGGGSNSAWKQLRQRWPRFAERGRAKILSTELSLEEAREIVAGENDFQSWAQLVEVLNTNEPGPLANLEQLRGLERLHDEFARLLGVNFTSADGVDRQVEVNTAFVDQTSYGEFVLSLSNPNRAFRYQADGFEGDLVLDIAMPIVQGLGATGGDQGDDKARLDYFAERIARDLEKVWAPIHQVGGGSFELYTDPNALELAPSHGIVLLVAFEVNAQPAETGWSGLVSLIYLGSTMVPFQSALADYWPEGSAARN